ncbi:MAG TPA: hypothetical protein VH643_03240 [Gemmataceae bacterium]|jgi:hypothetical protein
MIKGENISRRSAHGAWRMAQMFCRLGFPDVGSAAWQQSLGVGVECNHPPYPMPRMRMSVDSARSVVNQLSPFFSSFFRCGIGKDGERLWVGFNDERGHYLDNHLGKRRRHEFDPLCVRIEMVRIVID